VREENRERGGGGDRVREESKERGGGGGGEGERGRSSDKQTS
jgi:hypothetical protein